MYIYIISNTTNKVLRSLECEQRWTREEFFEKALRMVLACNGKNLSSKILVSQAKVSYSGVEITGCRLRIPHTKYGVFIQGLKSDDFVLDSEKEE